MKSPYWQRMGAGLALAALLVTSGSHWVVLQTVAWAGMFVRFAQEDTVTAALEKTFDGKHPCALCLKVREGRRSEPRQALTARADRLPDLALQPEGAVLTHAGSPPQSADYSNPFHLDWHVPPQRPPPRPLASVLSSLLPV